MTKRRIISFLLAAVVVAAGTAYAQVDPRARELLEGYASQAGSEPVRTLDQSTVMTLHNLDEPMETRSRTVIDFEGERAAIVSLAMGMETTMRFVDGEFTMSIGGMTMPVPPGMGVESAFDGIFDQPDAAGDLFSDPDATATYDGQVDYAGILSGQQVTYTGDFGVPGLDMEATTVRFVFDEAGELLGQVIEAEGMTLLTVVVGEPHGDLGLYFDMDMYELGADGTATLFANMRFESIAVNEPIDESLFQ